MASFGRKYKNINPHENTVSQIVEEGCFRGGTALYGYRLEKQGRFNKRNHEVFEILVDEQEAEVVKKIFDLYITKGMGSQRISTFLTEQGVFNRKGMNFTNCTFANMLKNRTYLGVLKSGETESKIF